MNLNSQLISQLASLHDNQFTGILTIKTKNCKSWNIYLYLGQLLWIESTIHSNRFWQRNLSKLCPKLIVRESKFNSNNNYISDYYLINNLRGNKILQKEKILELINIRVMENFFEILQFEFRERANFISQSHTPVFLLKAGFNLSLPPLKTFSILEKAKHDWVTWKNRGLASCSPNLAPLIKKDQNLQKQLSPIVFHNMLRLLDGKKTLRDLAIRMDKTVLEVTLGLIPYFFKGYLRLLEIPDTTPIYLRT